MFGDVVPATCGVVDPEGMPAAFGSSAEAADVTPGAGEEEAEGIEVDAAAAELAGGPVAPGEAPLGVVMLDLPFASSGTGAADELLYLK